jgi:hypothetical protein
MKLLFDLLSTLKFRHRLFNVGDARKIAFSKTAVASSAAFS